jgi:putative hydrolase of the HAD superfamily
MIKAVFFDAGETLIHRNPSLIKITYAYFRNGGYDISEKDISAALSKEALSMKDITAEGSMTDSEKWDHYMRLVFKALKVSDPVMLEKIKNRLKAGTSFRPYKEVPGVISGLRKKKIKLGVISNAAAQLKNVLVKTGLHDRFDHIIISELAGVEKPDRKIFLMAVKKAGVKKDEFLYVGDNYIADIKGGLGAGVHAVWLERKTGNAQFSYGGEAGKDVLKIRNLRQLMPLMKKEGWI